MGIFKDKERGSWYYVFQVDGRRYKGRGFSSRAAASSAEKERRRRVTSSVRLVSEVMEEKRADLVLHGHVQQSVKIEQVYRCRISPFLHDKNISDVTFSDVSKMADGLKRAGHSNNAINRAVSVLHSVFSFGFLHGYCSGNPCDRWQKLPHSPAAKTYWTEEDYHVALGTLEDRKRRLLLSVLYWTGIRKGEARALRWSDMDWETGCFSVERHFVEDGGHRILPGRKNGEGYVVALDNALLADLRAVYDVERSLPGFSPSWYILGDGRRPFALTTLAHMLDRIAARSGVPRITPHGLRHSHVSWLFTHTSLTPQEIADRIGDTPQVVLAVYAHLYSDPQRKVVEVINQQRK